jgi:hypothetical protein
MNITEEKEKIEALRVIVESTMPKRWDDARYRL